ncbi:hypothetical protein ABK040_001545 [Willaertia magna]
MSGKATATPGKLQDLWILRNRRMVSSLTHIHKYLTGYFFSAVYLGYNSYKHYQFFKWLGVDICPEILEKYKTLFPLQWELIKKLKQARDWSFNYCAPMGFGFTFFFSYNWYFKTNCLHHVSTQTAFVRGYKTFYFSSLMAMTAGLLPFVFTYYNVANQSICFDTTSHFYKFVMSNKDPEWNKKISLTEYGIKPHPFWNFKD